jgi:hypothetical protein
MNLQFVIVFDERRDDSISVRRLSIAFEQNAGKVATCLPELVTWPFAAQSPKNLGHLCQDRRCRFHPNP